MVFKGKVVPPYAKRASLTLRMESCQCLTPWRTSSMYPSFSSPLPLTNSLSFFRTLSFLPVFLLPVCSSCAFSFLHFDFTSRTQEKAPSPGLDATGSLWPLLCALSIRPLALVWTPHPVCCHWDGGEGGVCGAARRGLGCKRLGSQTPLQPRVSAPSGPLQGCPRGTRRPVSGSHTLISHSRCSFFYFFFQSVLLLHFPSFLSFPVSSVSLSLSLSLYLCPAFPTV